MDCLHRFFTDVPAAQGLAEGSLECSLGKQDNAARRIVPTKEVLFYVDCCPTFVSLKWTRD